MKELCRHCIAIRVASAVPHFRASPFLFISLSLLPALLLTHATVSAEASSSALVEIDCNSMPNSSYTISNATLTPTVRFYNCTNRSVNVVVAACGVAAESPLSVEVVGGIALPTFTLQGCLVGHGNDTYFVFENVSLTIRGVTMLYGIHDVQEQQGNVQKLLSVAPSNFGNPMSSTLLSMPINASSVALMVTDSRLTWVSSQSDSSVNGGFLLYCQGSLVNVTVSNTTMMAWTNRDTATFVRLGGVNERTLLNVENSTLVLSFNTDGGVDSTLSFIGGGYSGMELFSNSVVRLQTVVLIVNATASAVAPMQCLSLVGALSNMTLTVLNSDVIATCGRGLKLITVSAYVGADGVRVTVAGGTLQSVLTMTDVSLTSTAQFSIPGVVIVQFDNITEATNIDIAVSNFSLTTTVDYRSLSKPLLAPTTVGAIGTHGAVLLSQSPVSHCVVTLSNVEMSFEEMGAISISAYLQGFSVTALFFAVVVFYGYTSEFVTVVISNSSLMVSQQDLALAAAAISSSPTILAGVVVRSASVILVFAALRNGYLMVTNCTIASTAVVFSTAKATPVWNGVGIIYHASVGSFLQADQPQIVPYLSAILPDAFFSTINDSDIHIDTCTVTGPVLSATIISTIPPSIFRLSVAIVNFFNMHNTTTTIVASSSSSSSPSLASTASQELRECVCLAAVSLVSLVNYLHFQHCNTSHSGNTSSFISLRQWPTSNNVKRPSRA